MHHFGLMHLIEEMKITINYNQE